jgi:hypothetical protein
MSNNRNLRYRAPEPPRPAQRNQPPAGRNYGWLKMLLAAVVLAVIAGAYMVITGSSSSPQPAQQLAPPVAKPAAIMPAKKLSKWSWVYGTTFTYSASRVTVNNVRVSGLNRTKAKVTFSVTVTGPVPKAGKPDWVKRQDTWSMQSSTAGTAYPSGGSVSSPSGGSRLIIVSFNKWPSRSLYSGSSLAINMPGTAGQPIRLAVHIPRSGQ